MDHTPVKGYLLSVESETRSSSRPKQGINPFLVLAGLQPSPWALRIRLRPLYLTI